MLHLGADVGERAGDLGAGRPQDVVGRHGRGTAGAGVARRGGSWAGAAPLADGARTEAATTRGAARRRRAGPEGSGSSRVGSQRSIRASVRPAREAAGVRHRNVTRSRAVRHLTAIHRPSSALYQHTAWRGGWCGGPAPRMPDCRHGRGADRHRRRRGRPDPGRAGPAQRADAADGRRDRRRPGRPRPTPTVGALVVTGTAPAFCAGADLSHLGSSQARACCTSTRASSASAGRRCPASRR